MKEIILETGQYLRVEKTTGNKLVGYKIRETIKEHSTTCLYGKDTLEIKIDRIYPLGNDEFRLLNSNVTLIVKLIK